MVALGGAAQVLEWQDCQGGHSRRFSVDTCGWLDQAALARLGLGFRFSDARSEPVASAVQGFDIAAIPPILAQCLAYLADAEVYPAPKVDESFPAPELPLDFLARCSLTAAHGQEGEHPKRLWLKSHRRPSLSQLTVRNIQFEIVELQQVIRWTLQS
jgi:hypothetical protein